MDHQDICSQEAEREMNAGAWLPLSFGCSLAHQGRALLIFSARLPSLVSLV